MILPSTIAFLHAAAPLAVGGPWAGKAAFMGVFVLLLIWLVLMPARLIDQSGGPSPWWKSTRTWAIVVALLQIVIYLRWG